jgi:hypothetical protein
LLADNPKATNEPSKAELPTRLHAVPKHGLDADPFTHHDTTISREKIIEVKTEAEFETKSETKPELKVERKTELNFDLTTDKPTSKSESKGNLIDFDAFSEPVPPARTSRFTR